MAWTAAIVTYVVTAVAMLAVAGWLVMLKASSPRNRAFATFLVLRAVAILAHRIGQALGDPAAGLGFEISRYALLGQSFALAWFVVTLLSPLPSRWLAAALGAGAIATLVTYWQNHCLDTCFRDGVVHAGPLLLIANVSEPLLASAAILAAWQAYQGNQGFRSGSSWLLGCGLGLNALLAGATQFFDLVLSGPTAIAARSATPGWSWAGFWLLAAALPLAVAALVFLYRAATGPLGRPAWIWPLAAGALVTLATGALIVGGWTTLPLSLVLAALIRGLMPGLVAYSLVRHRFTERASPALGTVRGGVVGAAFMAVFFAVSEIVASLLSERIGLVAGVSATGLLIFVISPLQHLGDRVARRLTAAPGLDPVALYEEQVQIMWSDGVMGIKERLLLDKLQSRLGISAEKAKDIEHAVVLASA